jgi:branched-chain amino acid transport system ATP-binding protein
VISSSTTSLLRSEDLPVRFGGHAAVDRVTCAFAAGTLTAIVGPNGAGKTTYFNLLSGQLRATAGRVLLEGEDISRLPASSRARRGLGRAFQLTNLFPNLSVHENVRLAVQATAGRGHDLWSIWSSHRGLVEEADRIVGEVELEHRREVLAAELPHGDQRKLEVAILLALRPKVFMFDEPTAGMSAAEAPVILALIARIKQQRDKTVILVEHKLDVVRSLADRIVVLHQGQLVAEGEPADVMASPIVQEAYLGGATV